MISCILLGSASAQTQNESYQGHEVAGRSLIAKFKPGFSPNAAQVIHAHDLDRVEALTKNNDLFVLHSRSKNVAALLRDVGSELGIAYIEPNYIIRVRAVPNDPSFPQQWALLNSSRPGADIGATSAWNISTGSAANVAAVVDTGIDYTHPDLASNIWSAPSSFTVNVGGLIVTCPAGSHGFNAITSSCDPMDDNSHGTHVAGTIGAASNNGAGVAGINWTTRIMGLKFIGSNGSGDVASAVKAIEFAIQVKARFTGSATPVNVRVLSNSWGGAGFSQSLLDEINKANANDMLFVAAAGNNSSNDDVTPFYPAAYKAPNIITVAATDSNDNLAGFSDYGQTTVHLGAPGDTILSTIPGGGYAFYSGTSMATPHVSGAAMLVLSACSLNTAALKNNLLGNVDPITSLAGKTATGGRLNVGRAIQVCSGGGTVAAALSGISVSPNAITSGQTATGTVTLSAAAGAGGVPVSLSSSYPAGANLPATVTIPQGAASATFAVTAGTVGSATSVVLTASYLGVSRTVSLTVNPPVSSSAKASFVALDTSTQGNWKSKYGADGYTVVDNAASNPSYAAVTPSGALDYVWSSSTNDARALQKAAASDRIASTWYYPSSFSVDLNITDQSPHQVAVYCLDWDFNGRAQTVDVLDAATNAVLDTRSISGFSGGVYLVWAITGHVRLRFTLTSGVNAVVNGVFFGGSSSPSTASATFVFKDTTTQGNWKSRYGGDGYVVVDDTARNPSYATVTPSGFSDYVWNSSTTDVRALQKGVAGDRIASTWYSPSSFLVDLNITDQSPHQVAIYCLDWDSSGRAQTVDVLDAATNAVLDTRSLTGFSGGAYLVWNITGHVKLRLTWASGFNAVVGGVFFGGSSTPAAGSSASFLSLDTTTQGNWKSKYGADGYTLVDDSVQNPSYATLAPSGASDYVWSYSTADVRALQKGLAADRLAATWYSPSVFYIDLNLTDSLTHQVAAYCLDWDWGGRTQTVDVLDAATNTVLDSRTISGFSGGVYLVWNVSGHVKLRVTRSLGANGVVSGIFFR